MVLPSAFRAAGRPGKASREMGALEIAPLLRADPVRRRPGIGVTPGQVKNVENSGVQSTPEGTHFASLRTPSRGKIGRSASIRTR